MRYLRVAPRVALAGAARDGARGCDRSRWPAPWWRLRSLGVASAAAAQPPGDAAANLAGDGKLKAALALLDTWLADHPDDPRMFPVLLKVVTAAPRQPTVDAVVKRYRGRLASDQIAALRAAPADLAELSGGVVQALQALELPGIPDASERRAALLLELGEVTWDTAPEGMPIVHAGLARSGEGLGQSGLEPALRAAFRGSGTQGDGGAASAVAGYGLVSLLAANGRTDEAAAVLEQMRSRFPRSPEYALAAAELNAGAGLPRVVAFPSPAMLLGSLVATCLPPCPPPAAVLLARPAARGETPTVLVAEPPAVVAPPATKPITRLMVAPQVEPAVEATVVAAPETRPAPVAKPPPDPAPTVTVETPRAKSTVVVAAPASRPAAAVEAPAPTPAAKRVVVVTSSTATPVPAQAGAAPTLKADTGTGTGGVRRRCCQRAGAGLVAAHAPGDRGRGKHRGDDLQAPLGVAGSVCRSPVAGHQGGAADTPRRDSGQPRGAGLVAAGSRGVHRADRSLPRCGQCPGVGARAHRGGGSRLWRAPIAPPTAASSIVWPWAAT